MASKKEKKSDVGVLQSRNCPQGILRRAKILAAQLDTTNEDIYHRALEIGVASLEKQPRK